MRERTQPVRAPKPPEPMVRFVAELLDGVSKMDGAFTATLIMQAERAAKIAKLDPNLVDQACVWLDKQGRV